MSLLVESLHMRIDGGTTVVGVHELASGFIRRGFSFVFPCDYFVHHCDLEESYQPRPSPPIKYSVFVCTLSTFQGLPALSRPSHARTSPVELRIYHQPG